TRQVKRTSTGQFPLAVTLSCIDSRAPVEMVFDMGIGDLLSIRVAGNIASERILGNIEFACKIAGAKVILVMGHTNCGAISAAIDLFKSGRTASQEFSCKHLDLTIDDLQNVIRKMNIHHIPNPTEKLYEEFKTNLVAENVLNSIEYIKSN